MEKFSKFLRGLFLYTISVVVCALIMNYAAIVLPKVFKTPIVTKGVLFTHSILTMLLLAVFLTCFIYFGFQSLKLVFEDVTWKAFFQMTMVLTATISICALLVMMFWERNTSITGDNSIVIICLFSNAYLLTAAMVYVFSKAKEVLLSDDKNKPEVMFVKNLTEYIIPVIAFMLSFIALFK